MDVAPITTAQWHRGSKSCSVSSASNTIQHLPGVGRNHQERNEIPYLLKLKENINVPGPIDINCLTNGLIDDLCLLRAIGSTVN